MLILQPDDKLTKEDFASVAAKIDPYIESNGELKGVMIDAAKFPGWQGFSDMIAHFKFVRDHHKDIKRVAIVTDDETTSHMPGFVKHFVSAEVKHFSHNDKQAAMDWIEA
ncbi:STAS/SEC14 domain-containing protein [Mariniblastus sp.]|nr:STAS/SEC14 domain-containing protein [Mariniblastus sp.]